MKRNLIYLILQFAERIAYAWNRASESESNKRIPKSLRQIYSKSVLEQKNVNQDINNMRQT